MDKDKTLLLIIGLTLVALITSLTLKPSCSQGNIDCPECICEPCAFNQSDDLRIVYLMPYNCQDCDLDMVDGVEKRLQLQIERYITDSVPQASILVFKDGQSTLAIATRQYNIYNTLCEFANNSRACPK